MQPIIQPLKSSDLSQVALVHIKAFPDSALTTLGSEAVRRYYEWQLIGPHDCVAAASYVDSCLTGFIFGGVFRGALSGFLRKNKRFLIQSVLIKPWLIFNPLVVDRLEIGLRLIIKKPNRKVQQMQIADEMKFTPRSFGILAVAVDPTVQKAGIGQKLMSYAEEAARKSGFTQMHLTVQTGNGNAIRFYEHLGWEKVPQQNWTGRMVKKIA